MRQLKPHLLWLGNTHDAANHQTSEIDFKAIINLTDNEMPIAVFREACYCHFPLLDGFDNPDWLVRAAIQTVASLIVDQTPTLVFCSHGMSRTPVICALALAIATNRTPAECLEEVSTLGRLDVNPGLWLSARNAMNR